MNNNNPRVWIGDEKYAEAGIQKVCCVNYLPLSPDKMSKLPFVTEGRRSFRLSVGSDHLKRSFGHMYVLQQEKLNVLCINTFDKSV